jgi:hypothetical protein
MSSEAGLAALAAIDSTDSQNTTTFNQVIQAAQQWNEAQNFELGISEAAESLQTGAVACQQADLSCRGTAIDHNGSYTRIIPEVQVRPIDGSSDLGQQVITYVDQYSQRAKNYSSEIDNAVTKIEQAPPSATDLTPIAPPFDPATALKLLQHTYEFALETYLISNASSLSTRIFNQLMKEQ